MNSFAKLSVAAAVVVVAALLGFNYLVAPNIGTDGLGDPSPTPSPSPTPGPPGLSGDALDPGTYKTLEGVVDATLTVPDGWFNIQGYGVGKEANGPESFTAVVIWPSDREAARVYADPCRWQDGFVDPPVGPTVDDLATAFANQPLRGDAVPVDVEVDGYPGKMIELSVPNDIDFADCDGSEFWSWDGRYSQGPGQVDVLYILDVGGQRVVIDAHFMPGTSATDDAERQAILDSIQLEAP